MTMSPERTFFVLLIVLNFTAIDGKRLYEFVKNSSLTDTIKATGYMNMQPAASVIHCGYVCNENVRCVSYFYKHDDKMCQLHNSTFQDNYDLQTSVNTEYYVKTEEYFIECPQNDGNWAEARLTDGTVYMFKLMRTTKVSQPDALLSCTSIGGRLLKILTEEKMDFVRNNLTKCESIHGYSYWIDGSNANASDPFATDAYKTADNEAIPMTSYFWYPDLPDWPQSSHCIWISDIFGYKFDDVTCLHGLQTDGVYPICEKEVP
ncbi:uncharacterized protein LOC132745437 [Ruditapes philippinarum]|uniref:uncharacterized protein LOC132745437 n=1 Tax=Ruditapes philippinarum TaxID=129788 RepID=UPI00295BAB86|nr:uncharacterized protein LOC132745437 [Ruditapes philippinarum]